MTVKTDMSRFDIHDELTAPDESARLLKGMSSAGGSVSKFVGVLAGSPAALRAFARMQLELGRPTRGRAARLPPGPVRGGWPPGGASARGGPRGRLERRAAARGGRPSGAERVPEPDVERRRPAAGPVGPLHPASCGNSRRGVNAARAVARRGVNTARAPAG